MGCGHGLWAWVASSRRVHFRLLFVDRNRLTEMADQEIPNAKETMNWLEA